MHLGPWIGGTNFHRSELKWHSTFLPIIPPLTMLYISIKLDCSRVLASYIALSHIMPISRVHKSNFYPSFPKLTSFFKSSSHNPHLHKIQHYPHKVNIAMYLSHGSYHFVTYIHCVHVLHSFLGLMLFVVLTLVTLKYLAQSIEHNRKLKMSLELMTNNIHIYWAIMCACIIYLY